MELEREGGREEVLDLNIFKIRHIQDNALSTDCQEGREDVRFIVATNKYFGNTKVRMVANFRKKV